MLSTRGGGVGAGAENARTGGGGGAQSELNNSVWSWPAASSAAFTRNSPASLPACAIMTAATNGNANNRMLPPQSTNLVLNGGFGGHITPTRFRVQRISRSFFSGRGR